LTTLIQFNSISSGMQTASSCTVNDL